MKSFVFIAYRHSEIGISIELYCQGPKKKGEKLSDDKKSTDHGYVEPDVRTFSIFILYWEVRTLGQPNFLEDIDCFVRNI